MQSTSLLDKYLKATSSGVARSSGTAQSTQQPHSSTNAADFSHQRTIKDVHRVLDDVLQASCEPGSAASQHQTWLGALGDSTVAETQSQQQPQLAAQSQASVRGKHRPQSSHSGGIFRSMRQADAAVLLEKKLSAEEDQQQPIFTAAADHSNGAVRIIAGTAALQAKLQRLQADMEAKSYRQGLLQQLQTPASMFQPSWQNLQQPGQHITHKQQQQDGYSWLRSSDSKSPGVFHGLGLQDGTLRPATSPALVGKSVHLHPSSAYSTAATAGGSHSAPRPVSTGAAAAQNHGRHHQASTLHQQTADEQLQHLRELIEYEPPWPAAGKAAAATASQRAQRANSNNPGSVFRTRDTNQQRPWTSSGLRPARADGSDAIRHATAAPVDRPHARYNKTQPHHQQVPRPASAVAALEQSLSELASLRSKLNQPTLQHQQQTQPQQQYTGQAKHSLHQIGQWQQHDSSSRHPEQQAPTSEHTWLQDPRLQHAHGRASYGGMWPNSSTASVGLRTSQAGLSNLATAGSYVSPIKQHQGLGVLGASLDHSDPISEPLLYGLQPGHRCSLSPGYHVWDTWQHQIHRPAAAAAAVSDAHGYGHFAVSRSRSAPRPVRAWDAIPLPRTAVAVGAAASHGRGRRFSVSGLLTGHLQQHRQQQHVQRPKTTGGIDGLGQQQRGLRTGVRPLGLHNETVGYVPRGSAAPTAYKASAAVAVTAPGAAYRSSGGGNSTSTWLLSSPLQRTKQQLSAKSNYRANISTSGGATAVAGVGATGRGRAVAAALVGASSRQPAGPSAAAQALARIGSPVKLAPRAAVATAQQTHKPGTATAAATQLLQSLRQDRGPAVGSAGRTAAGTWLSSASLSRRARSPTLVYADRLSAATGRVGSSAGGAAANAAPFSGAQAALKQQVLAYAAQRCKSSNARRSSSQLSSSSDTSEDLPAVRKQQSSGTDTAYAAALARLKAAKQATQPDESSDSDLD